MVLLLWFPYSDLLRISYVPYGFMSFYTKDINSDMFVNTFSFKFLYKSLSLSIIFSLSILSSCSLGVVVLVAQSGPTLCNPWTVACRAPLSMGFSRQEYRSGLPFPSPDDLPHPGIEPKSSALQADSLPSELQGRSLSCFLSVINHLLILPLC